jgi:hypothetical protein
MTIKNHTLSQNQLIIVQRLPGHKRKNPSGYFGVFHKRLLVFKKDKESVSQDKDMVNVSLILEFKNTRYVNVCD